MLDWYQLVRDFYSCGGHDLAALHPYAIDALGGWAKGLLSPDEFMYLFTMPNSENIPVAECLLSDWPAI